MSGFKNLFMVSMVVLTCSVIACGDWPTQSGVDSSIDEAKDEILDELDDELDDLKSEALTAIINGQKNAQEPSTPEDSEPDIRIVECYYDFSDCPNCLSLVEDYGVDAKLMYMDYEGRVQKLTTHLTPGWMASFKVDFNQVELGFTLHGYYLTKNYLCKYIHVNVDTPLTCYIDGQEVYVDGRYTRDVGGFQGCGLYDFVCLKEKLYFDEGSCRRPNDEFVLNGEPYCVNDHTMHSDGFWCVGGENCEPGTKEGFCIYGCNEESGLCKYHPDDY